LPDKFSWQTTHNVAVDKSGNLYVIHEGRKEQQDHPSIFVFDAEGKFVRAFGSQFRGGHGIEVRDEGGEEFLDVAAYQQVKSFAKMTRTGETVWYRKAPMESGVYAAGEDTSTSATWNRKGFLPTNFAFLDDGGFLLADGYGSFHIHRYDKDANWISSFGGAEDGEGKFATAHGLWVDKRAGREPSIVVTDRAHNTLQIFDVDGTYLETLTGFGLPANIDSWISGWLASLFILTMPALPQMETSLWRNGLAQVECQNWSECPDCRLPKGCGANCCYGAGVSRAAPSPRP
jgi:hypothetical protein